MESTPNALYHFKERKEYLLEILNDFSFTPRYNKETIILKLINGAKVININCPMICWCDIPLERVKNHMDRYGCYGIGITKIWAVKNLINPVIYLVQDTGLANSIHEITKLLLDLGEKMNIDIELKNKIGIITGPLFQANNILSQFIKPYSYQGLSEYQEKRKFYDEKEWRYIPETTDALSFLHIPTKSRDSEITNEENNNLNEYKLSFNSQDIDIIIISTEEERDEFNNQIIKTLVKNTKSHLIDETLQKVKTYAQIMNGL